MEHPDRFDPYAGLWQDSQWHWFHILNPTGTENSTASELEGPPFRCFLQLLTPSGVFSAFRRLQHAGHIFHAFPPVQGVPPTSYHSSLPHPPPHYTLPPMHPIHVAESWRTAAADAPFPPSSPDPIRDILAQHTCTVKADKGKKRAHKPKEMPAVLKKPSPPQCQRGRASGCQLGSHNYCTEDLDMLLEIIKALQPIGQASWEEVTRNFHAWTKENGRPARMLGLCAPRRSPVEVQTELRSYEVRNETR
ncbi:hypothetical protein OH76DRAFT_1422932 [Lentinus brumalis]|uniref:Uncharacterized protein n=1 Tax=Lentinus brumalis TaxID=2498619 RepID=A0A371CN99_9APHY|nr:hypothetical protein OH76DRAFT_1422932 [Polyporus brumalis]